MAKIALPDVPQMADVALYNYLVAVKRALEAMETKL